jgi:hypothetical protein
VLRGAGVPGPPADARSVRIASPPTRIGGVVGETDEKVVVVVMVLSFSARRSAWRGPVCDGFAPL